MQTREFPPEVFARLAPAIYFERHITHNLRPTGRGLLERREVQLKPDSGESLRGSLGSAVVRAGAATVICGINYGLTRFNTEGGIYPNVEIHRGGMAGNPTGEEQVLTMQIHRLLGAAHIDPSLFAVNDEMTLCLTAQVVVLSRTGPMLDLVWQCLVGALQAAKIPKFVEDERTGELQPSDEDYFTLEFPDSMTTSLNSYGIVNGDLILADIDGAVEEECVPDRASIGTSKNGLTSVSINAPGGLSRDTIVKLLSIDEKS